MAAATQPLPLSRPPRLQPVAEAPRAPKVPARLWLCLHLPALALEALTAPPGRPLAVVEGEGAARRVAARNAAAARCGIEPGLRASAARALAPGLRLLPRNPTRERAALQRLAAWARRYTPVVVIEADALLLEVRGSLSLFGGLEALRGDAAAGLAVLGYTARTGVAPAPLAARWLALVGDPEPVLETSALPGRLAGLPVRALDWPADAVKRLEGFGIRVLGQVLRLPRDGLARRLGKHWPALLDKALGRRPDPRAAFRPPARFRATLELPEETESLPALAPALDRLLAELEAFLVSRAAGVQALESLLHHRDGTTTRVTLTLRRPARRAAKLAGLLGHRLESVTPAAPVQSVTLRSGRPRPWEAAAGDLIEGREHGHAGLTDLLQRLQARLGTDAVHGVEPAADHRPERAFRRTPPLQARPGPLPAQPRPLWLLPEPRPLGRGERPARCELLAGPERIVSGWWDEHGIARDYYRARDDKGRRLWVFRELAGDGGWYLHGLFA